MVFEQLKGHGSYGSTGKEGYTSRVQLRKASRIKRNQESIFYLKLFLCIVSMNENIYL